MSSAASFLAVSFLSRVKITLGSCDWYRWDATAACKNNFGASHPHSTSKLCLQSNAKRWHDMKRKRETESKIDFCVEDMDTEEENRRRFFFQIAKGAWMKELLFSLEETDRERLRIRLYMFNSCQRNWSCKAIARRLHAGSSFGGWGRQKKLHSLKKGRKS